MKTIGEITHSRTSEFQNAIFLNDPAIAYAILDTHLGPGGWYPENTGCYWTDIAVHEERYYAAYGEDSVMTQDAKMIYIEIEPTAGMKKTFESYVS